MKPIVRTLAVPVVIGHLLLWVAALPVAAEGEPAVPTLTGEHSILASVSPEGGAPSWLVTEGMACGLTAQVVSLPYTTTDRSLIGVPAWVGVRAWSVLGDVPWGQVAADWLSECTASQLCGLRDGLTIGFPSLPTDDFATTGGPWRVSARRWSRLEASWILPYLARGLLPGYVPRFSGTASLPDGEFAVGELLDLVEPALAGATAVCAEELRTRAVQVTRCGGPVDEVLCALAVALGAEWRWLSDSLLYLAPVSQGIRERAEVSDPDEAASRQLPVDPEGGKNLVVAIEQGSLGGAWYADAVITPEYPGLELTCSDASGEQRRALLLRWVESRAVQYAFPAVERSLHCAVAAIRGFALHGGMRIPEDHIDNLYAATRSAGDLDGNQLIELAASVGVELVGVKGTLNEIGSVGGTAIVHLEWGHYVAVTDCDSAFVTLLGVDGQRARFPKAALESGMSGIMFVTPELLQEENPP